MGDIINSIFGGSSSTPSPSQSQSGDGGAEALAEEAAVGDMFPATPDTGGDMSGAFDTMFGGGPAGGGPSSVFGPTGWQTPGAMPGAMPGVAQDVGNAPLDPATATAARMDEPISPPVPMPQPRPPEASAWQIGGGGNIAGPTGFVPTGPATLPGGFVPVGANVPPGTPSWMASAARGPVPATYGPSFGPPPSSGPPPQPTPLPQMTSLGTPGYTGDPLEAQAQTAGAQAGAQAGAKAGREAGADVSDDADDGNVPPAQPFMQPNPASAYTQAGDPSTFGGGYAGMVPSDPEDQRRQDAQQDREQDAELEQQAQAQPQTQQQAPPQARQPQAQPQPYRGPMAPAMMPKIMRDFAAAAMGRPLSVGQLAGDFARMGGAPGGRYQRIASAGPYAGRPVSQVPWAPGYGPTTGRYTAPPGTRLPGANAAPVAPPKPQVGSFGPANPNAPAAEPDTARGRAQIAANRAAGFGDASAQLATNEVTVPSWSRAGQMGVPMRPSQPSVDRTKFANASDETLYTMAWMVNGEVGKDAPLRARIVQAETAANRALYRNQSLDQVLLDNRSPLGYYDGRSNTPTYRQSVRPTAEEFAAFKRDVWGPVSRGSNLSDIGWGPMTGNASGGVARNQFARGTLGYKLNGGDTYFREGPFKQRLPVAPARPAPVRQVAPQVLARAGSPGQGAAISPFVRDPEPDDPRSMDWQNWYLRQPGILPPPSRFDDPYRRPGGPPPNPNWPDLSNVS